jgi:hypothetical protein
MESKLVGSLRPSCVAFAGQRPPWTDLSHPAGIRRIFQWNELEQPYVDRGPTLGAREFHKIATALSALSMGVGFAFDTDFAITPYVADRQEIRHHQLAAKRLADFFAAA